jgi:hypothetical protein
MAAQDKVSTNAAKTSTGQCSLYYAERCRACGRDLLYCANSCARCVCNDRCPTCGKPALLRPDEHWIAKTLLRFF